MNRAIMNRAIIWVSKELHTELNKEKAKIKVETGREPTWEEFVRSMYDAYKKLKEVGSNERVD